MTLSSLERLGECFHFGFSFHNSWTEQAGAHIEHVVYRLAVLGCQAGYVEAFPNTPAHLQLLFGPMQQVIQSLIIDLTVGSPAKGVLLSLQCARHQLGELAKQPHAL